MFLASNIEEDTNVSIIDTENLIQKNMHLTMLFPPLMQRKKEKNTFGLSFITFHINICYLFAKYI